jgi:hypothetical protein
LAARQVHEELDFLQALAQAGLGEEFGQVLGILGRLVHRFASVQFGKGVAE